MTVSFMPILESVLYPEGNGGQCLPSLHMQHGPGGRNKIHFLDPLLVTAREFPCLRSFQGRKREWWREPHRLLSSS
jgi:hypothetical protein